jgi:type IV fimbrial biogenesis protein FimT
MEGRSANMRGFTLVESLLAVALVALLLALGMPSLRVAQASLRTTIETHRLRSLLEIARVEAVAAHADVVLCPLAAESGPACAERYVDGWLLFRDADRDGRYRPPTDQPLRIEYGDGGSALRVTDRNGAPFSGGIIYRPNGSVTRPATLRLCARAARFTVAMVVSLPGRVRISRENVPCRTLV